jgi:hypothetical protein
MVNLFEKDSNDLKKYFKAISSSCQKIMNAQVFLYFHNLKHEQFLDFFFFILFIL